MDVKKFMDKDMHHVEAAVKELSENITRWDSDKVFEKAKEMFDLFWRRFALEDFMLCKLKPNASLQPGIEKFLKRRREFREILEGILNFHVDEPDFRKEIGALLEKVRTHLNYRENEFYPQVINRLSKEEAERFAEALEDGLILSPPAPARF